MRKKLEVVAKESVFQRVKSFTKELMNNYLEDDAFNLGAALAYYTVFSFAPLLMIATSIASYFVGKQAVSGRLHGELSKLLGANAADSIQEMVSNAYNSGDSVWATTLSIATLIFAATGVFANLQISLNKIWEIKVKPDNGIKEFLMKRILSFGFVIGLGFLLMVTLVLNALVLGFMDQLSDLLPGIGTFVLAFGSWLLTTAITALIFALMFRYLPDAKARWKDIWIGAIFTALLFGLGRVLIGYYLGNSDFSSTYGAAAALMTLLVWTYYNSQILFLGAEFTFVWAERSGNPIIPDAHAVRVKQKEIPVEPEGGWPKDDDEEEEDDRSVAQRIKDEIRDDPDRVSQRPVG